MRELFDVHYIITQQHVMMIPGLCFSFWGHQNNNCVVESRRGFDCGHHEKQDSVSQRHVIAVWCLSRLICKFCFISGHSKKMVTLLKDLPASPGPVLDIWCSVCHQQTVSSASSTESCASSTYRDISSKYDVGVFVSSTYKL